MKSKPLFYYSQNHYYPFGMAMPGRKFGAASRYRYGFNGKENDKDAGEGVQDYGMRIYYGRLGRFLSVDPLTKSYPHYTPYSYAGNKPIKYIDLDGLEEHDSDRYYDRALPGIAKMYANNIAKLPVEQQAKISSSLEYATEVRDLFKNNYRWLSARMLTRWAEGKGGTDILSYDAVDCVQLNSNIREVGRNLVKKTLAYSESLNTKGSYEFTAFSQVDRTGSDAQAITNDVGSALGSYKLLGKTTVLITIDEDGNKQVNMDVKYTLVDKYQWKKDRGFTLPFLPPVIVDHNKMLDLEKIGAKPFHIRGYFKQYFLYQNGKQVLKTDIRDASTVRGEEKEHLQPRSDHPYSIPDEDSHVVNDK